MNKTPTHVAVIGAAGQTGRPIVKALAQHGAKVLALVHRKHPTSSIEGADKVKAIELGKITDLIESLEGIDVAYYIPPVFNSHEKTFGKNIIKAAEKARLPRLVYHSVMHSFTPSMPHHRRKAMVELAIRESQLVWTIVQPCMYAQTPLAFLDERRNELRVGFNIESRFTPIDLEDLATAVASILLEEGHQYATYELAGAQQLNAIEMAKIIAKILNREIKVVKFPSIIVAAVAASRLGHSAFLPMKAMLNHYDKYGLSGNSNILKMLIKREPHDFSASIEKELNWKASQIQQ